MKKQVAGLFSFLHVFGDHNRMLSKFSILAILLLVLKKTNQCT